MVEQGNKQVRVDNWGTFFLQRLQVFFAKTDYCDLTLQFDGNVQLKVHRLVMNACTEYFRFLEETCPAHEENTIMMPQDLQSDVIVPIVNFMYTGMLEFHISLYERLYKAAELMNISILTKLLDAQKMQHRIQKPRPEPPPPKKVISPTKPSYSLELPPPLPGRKLPIWKRKTVQPVSSSSSVSTSYPTSTLQFDQKWSNIPSEPLSDNTPKPARFEWPEDDLPTMSLLETSFEDISYTSKPLLTKEEEEKIKPNFDDLRNNVELPKKISIKSTNTVDLKEMEEFAKEQKIRNAMFEDVEEANDIGQKRKIENNSPQKFPAKKIKINNKENKETTISVESVTPGDIDHTKIVTEILKKYPDLVKKNKNIKLKIMPGNKDTTDKKVVNAVVEQVKRQPSTPETAIKPAKPQPMKQTVLKKKSKSINDDDNEGPWVCRKCIRIGDEVQEFVLYYLYRKHMTDIHDEVFDASLCKYCGCKCNTHNLMLYHMYTKHALKPPASYNFPKCDRCPYIAISVGKLLKHRKIHNPTEMQCQDCQLAFVSAQCLTAHIRITGHYNKPGRVSYDCQYCMKKLQSGMTLFSHIKKSHLPEAKRDGMVCLEESETLEDLEDEDEGDEYIIPDVLTESGVQKDKVKIISNVKVPPNHQGAENSQQSQLVPLETSSEAEALNNVATGIATSLGLVDIVVLDDNQQYILQQDGQNEQTEFIIPDLAHGQPFTGQVITTEDNAVIQQSMMQSSTGDIASTDELVMVLTDHDYPDEHEGENPDNSNIVVLYSHPVDGQEGQFITSQGNLMVNSQTGMLELRNGSTIATTAPSQMIVTNSVDTPIESIEMIQREINSHGSELKQEPLFEEERKSTIREQPVAKLQNMPDIHDIAEPDIHDIAEPETESTDVENQTEQSVPAEKLPKLETEKVEDVQDVQEPIVETLKQPQEEVQEDKDTTDDNVDGTLDISAEEAMEIDVEHQTAETEETGETMVPDQLEEEEEQEVTNTDTSDLQSEVNTNKPEEQEEEEDDVYVEEVGKAHEEEESVDVPPEKSTGISLSDVDLGDQTCIEIAQYDLQKKEEIQNEVEPMEVDEQVQDNLQDVEKEPENIIEENIPESQTVDETDNTIVNEEEEDVPETQQAEDGSQEQVSEEPSQIEENKDAEEAPNNVVLEPETQLQSKKNPTDINKTILDDWEDDTDSQQSEKNVTESQDSQDSGEPNKEESVPSAVENVNKLMDDWDEEEEEEKKE